TTATTDSYQQSRTHRRSTGGSRNTESEFRSGSDSHQLALDSRKRKRDSVDTDLQELHDQIKRMKRENDIRLTRLEENRRRPAERLYRTFNFYGVAAVLIAGLSTILV